MTLNLYCSVLALLMASTASAQLNRFAGEWENIDSNTGGVTKLNISVDQNNVTVQAWGKCVPQDCDWGRVVATGYALNVSSNLVESAQTLSAVFRDNAGQRQMIIHVMADRLSAEVLTQFTDRSGRTNYTVVHTFIRKIPLTVATLPQFIDWASRSDSVGHLKTKEEIIKARQNSTLLPPLFEAFEKSRRDNDLARGLVVVGIIGALKNPQAMDRLAALINEPLPQPENIGHRGISKREVDEMIKAKAVQCLTYIQTPASDKLALSIMQQHPSVAVRSSAVDAYLYNHGDSAAVKERLKSVLRKEDLPFLDRVRRTSTISPQAFNEGLERYYRLHAKEISPQAEEPPESRQVWQNILRLLFVLVALILALVLVLITLKKRKNRTKKN